MTSSATSCRLQIALTCLHRLHNFSITAQLISTWQFWKLRFGCFTSRGAKFYTFCSFATCFTAYRAVFVVSVSVVRVGVWAAGNVLEQLPVMNIVAIYFGMTRVAFPIVPPIAGLSCFNLIWQIVVADVNECANGMSNCLPDEECVHSKGSFQCVPVCHDGFRRSPVTLLCDGNTQI